ncbi:methyltransferase family protein [Pseudonocardia sediminis]|uniref:Methyltransferase family protein n=1 Tax=Pseudonocardia sediminis TaxID=1397368 RepID=A0A4Q7V1A7_PSEST|nr:class I SAM-dependent methyltransferase [Pseudonocardia sediminis]RZT86339.1 methyltransferase family protein [Pseudonocardia sediminis]
MRRGNARQQREVAELLDGLPGRTGARAPSDVVEVGCGPGVLLGMLAGRTTTGHLTGIDPSPGMRLMAARSTAPAVADDRVRIRPGDAGCTGLPDAVADVVVSVNSVAIWPDLDAGIEELGRVLRPDGYLVLSWHGGSAPSRSGAAMSLTAEQLDRVDRALSARFGDVRRELTTRCTVFVAHRCLAGSPRSPERPEGSPRSA